MKRIQIILIVVIIVSAAASVIAFSFINDSSSSPPQTLPECNTLLQNGEESINIVFLSPKEKAEQYMNYILTLVPFNAHKDKFNFYNIEGETNCELWSGIALYCDNRETVKLAGACPYDYIVVSEPQPRTIRSSASRNVMSLNLNHQNSVFAHEIGHALKTHFAEEYITTARIPRDSENCQKTCDKFKEFSENSGCYEGCTDSSHFREFENGFMLTLSATSYGPFNEDLLQKAIIEETNEKSSTLTGFAIQEPADCSQQKYFLVEGTYNKNENQINQIYKELVQGCAPKPIDDGLLSYKVLSESETVLEGTAHPEYIFIHDGEELNEETSSPAENDQPFIITIPETDNSELLQISDEQGSLIEEINLKDLGARPCLI